jgi:hypothetical protein
MISGGMGQGQFDILSLIVGLCVCVCVCVRACVFRRPGARCVWVEGRGRASVVNVLYEC